ncbi:MAG TPA: SemiSWEET transporter [Edaphobacter sp.]|jgi:MtN3 and saliva related transmembrane protein|nr:SemiSWEET transporter [Edaphobacter sp.]
MMSLSTQGVGNIGFLAAFCTTMAFVPQFVRVLKLRSARDISLGAFLLFSIGVFLWLLCGIYSGSKPVIVSNAATLGLPLSILYFKMRYRRASLEEEL